MTELRSRVLEDTLSHEEIHRQWNEDYGFVEGAELSEKVFDRIVRLLAPEPDAEILDAGCGSGTGSILLARRGFRVRAVDFSPTVLDVAAANVRTAGLTDRVRIQPENLLSLSFPDGAFRYILCWGVLMHVAEIERALSELARVLGPGGRLVISEINLHSLQRDVFVGVTRLLKRPRAPETRTPAGMECWFDTPDGMLLRRHTDIGWLSRTLAAKGLVLKNRLPGEFTELYLKASSPRTRAAIHKFNSFWFQYIRTPRLAFGNVLVFEKKTSGR